MRARYLIIAITLLLLIAAGLVAAAWLLRPVVVEVAPSNGGSSVPVTSEIRLAFSRPMNHTSVVNRLSIEPPVDGAFTWEGNSLIFTPDFVFPGGSMITVRLGEGARAASWLAFPMQEGAWSFSTGEARLAYLWPSDGEADIYTLDPDTGEVIPYTQSMGVLEFSASGDGLWLYFSASNAAGGSDLYMLERKALSYANGNAYQPTRIVECGVQQCRFPEVSPDGRYLAFEQINPTVEGEAGSAMVRLVRLPDLKEIPLDVEGRETVQPSWSIRGWLAYYDQTSQVYEVFSPDTRERWQTPNQTGQPGCWSPDGNFYLAPELFYHPAEGNSETGTSHLLRYDIQQGTSADLSRENDVEDVEGCYSPGGEWIAFARKYLQEATWSFGRQLWVMNADGSNPHAITDEPNFNHYDLAWSRDGQMLAYVRFDQVKLSDPPELWMVNTDGSNPIQLVIGGFSPLWIP
jgi:Tol biopolymer transport system component